MKKKILAALLVVALAVLPLAACGQADTGSGGAPAPAPEASADNSAADPAGSAGFANVDYTLKLVTTGWDTQAGQADVENALNDKFAELGYPGLGVEIIGFSWADYDAGKMATFVLSGEDYDVVWVPEWVNFYREARDGGAWQPWDNYLNIVPEYYEMIEPYIEIIKEDGFAGSTVKEVMRVPTFKEFTNTVCAMRFNLTAARGLGIENELRNIKSLDELDPYLQMFLDKYPERMPVLAVDSGGLAGAFNGGQDTNTFGPVYNRDSDSFKIGVFEPWFMEYMNTLRRWVDAGFIPEYQTTEVWENLKARFGAESFLVYFNSGKPGLEAEMNMKADIDGFEWGVTDFSDTMLDRNSILGNPYALNANAKNPEVAAFIYQMLCTNAELNNILNFGIEGVNWTLESDGTLNAIPDSGYAPNIMAWLGNRLLCHRLPGEPEGGVGLLYEEANASALIFPNFGFNFSENYIDNRGNWDVFWGVSAQVKDQYERSMHTGRLTDSDIATIQQMLTNGHAEYMISIYDKAYEDFKNSK